MLHAVIMAGGSGTRFWPRSRRTRPKQLLRLFGDRTMIQQTYDRIAPLVAPEQVLVITGGDLAQPIRDQLPEIPADRVVAEPCPRDTAPCVALAALLILKHDPEGVMAVLSADHRIEPPEAFRETIQAAVERVRQAPETFLVFGVRPTRPEIGYGYIAEGDLVGRPRGIAVHRVHQFREKPPLELAQQFLAEGRWVWNAGIFVWRAATVLAALERFRPDMTDALQRIAAALGTDAEAATIAREFPALARVPIDKAVMEKYEHVEVIEVPYTWSDVGDWRSLAELLPADPDGNVTEGRVRLAHAHNNMILADDERPVFLLGVDNLVVVQSGGATLVARKDQLDRLKGFVEGLGDAGFGDTL